MIQVSPLQVSFKNTHLYKPGNRELMPSMVRQYQPTLALSVALCPVVGPRGSELEHFRGQNQVAKTLAITQFLGFKTKQCFPQLCHKVETHVEYFVRPTSESKPWAAAGLSEWSGCCFPACHATRDWRDCRPCVGEGAILHRNQDDSGADEEDWQKVPNYQPPSSATTHLHFEKWCLTLYVELYIMWRNAVLKNGWKVARSTNVYIWKWNM